MAGKKVSGPSVPAFYPGPPPGFYPGPVSSPRHGAFEKVFVVFAALLVAATLALSVYVVSDLLKPPPHVEPTKTSTPGDSSTPGSQQDSSPTTASPDSPGARIGLFFLVIVIGGASLYFSRKYAQFNLTFIVWALFCLLLVFLNIVSPSLYLESTILSAVFVVVLFFLSWFVRFRVDDDKFQDIAEKLELYKKFRRNLEEQINEATEEDKKPLEALKNDIDTQIRIFQSKDRLTKLNAAWRLSKMLSILYQEQIKSGTVEPGGIKTAEGWVQLLPFQNATFEKDFTKNISKALKEEAAWYATGSNKLVNFFITQFDIPLNPLATEAKRILSYQESQEGRGGDANLFDHNTK